MNLEFDIIDSLDISDAELEMSANMMHDRKPSITITPQGYNPHC